MANDLEKRVAAIEDRNRRVESDKDWETSWTRRATIGLLTYIVIVIYLFIIDNDRPFIDALAPPIGFVLSTLVVRRVKKIWQSKKLRIS